MHLSYWTQLLSMLVQVGLAFGAHQAFGFGGIVGQR
jgi:hypothetical protein